MPLIQDTSDFWIRKAILSFPTVITPKSVNNGAPKFSASFIIDPQSEDWALLMHRVTQIAHEKWADQAVPIMNMIANDKRMRAYGAGTEKVSQSTGLPYAGYSADNVYINAITDTKPQLIGTNGQPLAPTEENLKMVGGNVVSAIVRPWAQQNEHGKAIRCQLVAVQYLEEGEHFGHAEVDATSVFQPVAGAPAAAAGAMPPMPGMNTGTADPLG